jgi:hypothetical protein
MLLDWKCKLIFVMLAWPIPIVFLTSGWRILLTWTMRGINGCLQMEPWSIQEWKDLTSLSPAHEGDTYFEPLFHEKLKTLPATLKAKVLVRPLCLALSYMLLYLVDQSISCFLQGDGETYCHEESEGWQNAFRCNSNPAWNEKIISWPVSFHLFQHESQQRIINRKTCWMWNK